MTVDDFSWAMEQLGLTGEGTVGLTKARRMILAYRVRSCGIMMLALCIVQSGPAVRACHGVAHWGHSATGIRSKSDCSFPASSLAAADSHLPAQTELVELTAELISGADGAHIGYEACPTSTLVWRLHLHRPSYHRILTRCYGVYVCSVQFNRQAAMVPCSVPHFASQGSELGCMPQRGHFALNSISNPQ